MRLSTAIVNAMLLTSILGLGARAEAAPGTGAPGPLPTIRSTTPLQPPDLVISLLAVAPTSALPGSDINVTFKSRNQGGGASQALVRIYYSNDSIITTGDAKIGELSYAVPAGGESPQLTITVNLPAQATPGTRYLGAIIDPGNAVPESNENNNSRAAPLSVQAAVPPDLTVNQLTVSPSTALPGAVISVTGKVSNTGGGTHNADVRLYYSPDNDITANDTHIGSFGVMVPAGGESQGKTITVHVPAQPQFGTRYIGAIVDPTNTIGESNENNNRRAAVFTVRSPDLADLQVSLLTVSPTAVLPESNINLAIKLRNSGGGTHKPVVRIYYSHDNNITAGDTLLKEWSQTLCPGEETPQITTGGTVPALAMSGTRYIGAIIDPGDAIPESHEANNTRAAVFTVKAPPAPDFVVNMLTVSPAAALPGAQIKVNCAARNQGGGAHTAMVRIYYSPDPAIAPGDLVIKELSFTLPANGTALQQSVTLTLPQQAEPGARYIGAMVDPRGLISEANETNNNRAANISILALAPADLKLSQMSLSSTRVSPGGGVQVSFRAHNAGAKTATAPVRIYFSTGPAFNSAAIQLGEVSVTLEAFSSTPLHTLAVQLPDQATLGTRYIIARIDPEDSVPESNESNNSLPAPLLVLPPTPRG